MGSFYCIAHKEQYMEEGSPTLLRQASEAQNVPFVPIYPEEFDHLAIPTLFHGDMVYRVATGQAAHVVENLLLQPGVTSFYKDPALALRPLANPTVPYALERVGVAIVPTIYSLPRDSDRLKKYTEYLGGFPIIVKELGGSHGVGVMKIESLESLISVSDVLNAKGGSYVMRKFVDYKTHYRLIVVGEEVVGIVEYPRVDQDFRSNVGEDLDVVPADCDDGIKQQALDAVRAKSLEYGGVDILVDRNGTSYVAEANFPCFFPRVQIATGIDVAGKMLEYLVQKAASSNVHT